MQLLILVGILPGQFVSYESKTRASWHAVSSKATILNEDESKEAERSVAHY